MVDLMHIQGFSEGEKNPHWLTDFRADPDLEFEGLLKRQHTRVKYFQGSLMNAMDLERAKVTERVPMKAGKRSRSLILDF